MPNGIWIGSAIFVGLINVMNSVVDMGLFRRVHEWSHVLWNICLFLCFKHFLVRAFRSLHKELAAARGSHDRHGRCRTQVCWSSARHVDAVHRCASLFARRAALYRGQVSPGDACPSHFCSGVRLRTTSDRRVEIRSFPRVRVSYES